MANDAQDRIRLLLLPNYLMNDVPHLTICPPDIHFPEPGEELVLCLADLRQNLAVSVTESGRKTVSGETGQSQALEHEVFVSPTDF